jgi:tetratricopeptide (TPR) repeat protein
LIGNHILRIKTMTELLEDSLARVEKALEASLKAAQNLQASLRKAKSAAKTGALRDLDKALAASSTAASEFGRQMEACKAAWTFDAEAYFNSGGYTSELFQAAADAGLQLSARDGSIACYPMLLRIAPKDLAVLIDRKPERRVRPTVLVRLLAQRQKQPAKMNVAALLETIASAYKLLAPRFDRAWTVATRGAGPAVPLSEIHHALTLMPGAAREYPLAEFARDLHLLDRSPATRTKDGRSFRFEASTGSRTLRRLSTVDQHGAERSYVAIRLILE